MSERKIKSSILHKNGKIYRPGQEDELNEVLTPFQVERLIAKGAISGDFTGRSLEDFSEDMSYRALRNLARDRGLYLGRNPSKAVLIEALKADAIAKAEAEAGDKTDDDPA